MPIVIGILVLIVLALVITNVRIVPQANAYVLERLGVYSGTWNAGLHLKVPFIDRIVRKISLKEQVLDFPPQSVITKDNVTMNIDAVVYAHVFDPMKYCYGVENALLGLQNLTATTLRSVIGDMELDATLSGRADINNQMQQILDEATDAWGLKVTRVEIKNIQPPKEIEEVMTKQMRAERERRQTLLEAQAHKEAVVSRAEGDKQAKVLAAQAESEAQKTLAEGRAAAIEAVSVAEAKNLSRLAESGANELVLRLKAIEAMKDISDGQATKIFIPNDLANHLVTYGLTGEMLGTAPTAGQSVPRSTLRKQQVQEQVKSALESDPCLDEGSTAQSRGAAIASERMQASASLKANGSKTLSGFSGTTRP